MCSSDLSTPHLPRTGQGTCGAWAILTVTFDHVLAVLPAFLLACVVLAALPGPATALFIHRAVRDGRSAGLATVAGNEIGLFVWLLAGGAGVSALLVANRVLFDGMHIVGAVVLIILGFQAGAAPASASATAGSPRPSSRGCPAAEAPERRFGRRWCRSRRTRRPPSSPSPSCLNFFPAMALCCLRCSSLPPSR